MNHLLLYDCDDRLVIVIVVCLMDWLPRSGITEWDRLPRSDIVMDRVLRFGMLKDWIWVPSENQWYNIIVYMENVNLNIVRKDNIIDVVFHGVVLWLWGLMLDCSSILSRLGVYIDERWYRGGAVDIQRIVNVRVRESCVVIVRSGISVCVVVWGLSMC